MSETCIWRSCKPRSRRIRCWASCPMILIFGIFYFLLFMPMQKQKKQQRQMLAALQNGNVVQTTGGIVGTIVSLNCRR